MNGFQNIKRQLLPLIKGSPIVAVVFLTALFTAKKVINYSPNMYQTIAKIKLDDQKYGFSNNNLFSDFDMFSTENKIEAEAEILKSPLIIEKVLDNLNFDIVVYRKGHLKNTMLYDDCPFIIEYSFDDEKLYDKLLHLKILDNNSWTLKYLDGREIVVNKKFNVKIEVNGGWIKIEKNKSLLANRSLQLLGEYEFKVFSRSALISDISNRLDVTAVDKEVAILRVVYKEEHPNKVADLVNALCQAYIDDYVITKSNAANKTVEFVNKKLIEVGDQLQRAELELEQFKIDKNVVNTLQETETGLREISKLNIQLINLEMNEQAIQQLQTYIESGNYFEETAINFGFGDLLMTELVKKMKLCQDERRDLLIKFTPEDEKVKTVDAKIEETEKYIKEAINQNLREIQVKRADIQTVVDKTSHIFDDLPTREKTQHILERKFRLLEDVYNFLSQKNIEASIASSATISFHRVIQPATIPKEPVSPNKTLITFVFGLLGLIMGIAFIYIKKYIRARVTSKEDIEKCSTLPVVGVIRHKNTQNDFEMLAKSFLIKNLVKKGQSITVCSTLSKEGKSYVAYYLAVTMIDMGYSICLLLDANQNQKKPNQIKLDYNQLAIIEYSKNYGLNPKDMTVLNSEFDFVIIDSISTAVDISGVEAMKLASLNLYLVRSNHTCMNYVSHPDLLAEEYKINTIQIVLNDAHKATNYSGNYIGSRFRNYPKPQGVFQKIKNYYRTYFVK